jgi:hypothetical protein
VKNDSQMAKRHRNSYEAGVDDVHVDNEDPRSENKGQCFCHRSPHLKSEYARERRLSRLTTVNSLTG